MNLADNRHWPLVTLLIRNRECEAMSDPDITIQLTARVQLQ
jgi:hypothetical protein